MTIFNIIKAAAKGKATSDNIMLELVGMSAEKSREMTLNKYPHLYTTAYAEYDETALIGAVEAQTLHAQKPQAIRADEDAGHQIAGHRRELEGLDHAGHQKPGSQRYGKRNENIHKLHIL